MSSGEHIRLGVLTRTYGLAGGLRLALDDDTTPLISVPCDAWIGYSAAFVEPVRLERYERRSRELICHFAGIADRSAAEKLLDRALFLPAEALEYVEPLSHPRLVGYEVRDDSGKKLGTITSIFRTPAHFIWQVESDGHEWMMPAIDQFVAAVRHELHTAIVRPIPGMVIEEPEHGEPET